MLISMPIYGKHSQTSKLRVNRAQNGQIAR